jgi:hypothetical protein
VSVAQVAQWNGVAPKARFKPGQTIIVMRAVVPKRVAARHAPAKRVTKAGAAPRERVAER